MDPNPYVRFHATARKRDRFDRSNQRNTVTVNLALGDGAGVQGECITIGAGIDGVADVLEEPIIHVGGSSRSGAEVRDAAPFVDVARAQVGEIGVVYSRPHGRRNTVVKENADERTARIEAELYRAIRNQPTPEPSLLVPGEYRQIKTPAVVSVDGRRLTLEKIQGTTLDDYLSQLASPFLMDPLETSFKLNQLLRYVMAAAATIDIIVDRTLSADDLAYLREKAIAPLLRFGDRETVERRYHAYRVLDVLDLGDDFARLFAPVEQKIQEGMQRYGTGIGGVYARNVLVHDTTNLYRLTKELPPDVAAALGEADDLTAIYKRPDVQAILKEVERGLLNETTFIDFNHPDHALMQTTDSFLLDAYMPVRAVNYRAHGFRISRDGMMRLVDPNQEDERPNTREGELFLCAAPIDEGDRLGLLGYKAKIWNELDPDRQITDLHDYGVHFYVARVARNLRQLGHVLREVRENEDAAGEYQKMYDGVMAAYHHLGLACISLTYLERVAGQDTRELREHIYRRGNELIEAAVAPEEWDDCIAWMNLPS